MPPVPWWPGATWAARFLVVWGYVQDLLGTVIFQSTAEVQYLETAFQWLG